MAALKHSLLTVTMVVGVAMASDLSAGDPFRGQSIYTKHCTQCHGGDGAGALSGTPSFRAGSKTIMKPDNELVETIRHGKGIMPGFGSQLKDDQIFDVVAYIRTFF